MTLNARTLAATILVVFFGGILFANGLGWWKTESTKEAAVYTSGEFAGQANPADIRGSYTFGDVQENFDIPAEVLAEAFGISTDEPENYPVKSLESAYAVSANAGFEIGTASVRVFVAFYHGLPFDLSTDIYLPESAAKILTERALSAEYASYLSTHTISAETVEQVGSTTAEGSADLENSQETPMPESHDQINQYTIKGKTTFSELLDWGISQETIEEILGMPMPMAKGTLIRDFCAEHELSFETIKTSLQAEVDKVIK